MVEITFDPTGILENFQSLCSEEGKDYLAFHNKTALVGHIGHE